MQYCDKGFMFSIQNLSLNIKKKRISKTVFDSSNLIVTKRVHTQTLGIGRKEEEWEEFLHVIQHVAQ